MAKNKGPNQSQPATVTNQKNIIATKIEQSSFSGPLPPPQLLDHYDKIVPGSADKIISLWEEQVRHRQGLEKKAIDADIKQASRGSWFGFAIAMSAIGSGTYLAYIGRPTEGIAAILTALVGLVGAFGWGTYQRRKERTVKSSQ